MPIPRFRAWDGDYILIAGGTYGYKDLLDAADGTKLEKVVLQTGKVSPENYIERHSSWRVFSTIDNFDEIIAGASVVVAPPGATPLEAVAYCKKIVIVKYPEWSKAGTLVDAKLFSEKINAAFLSNLSPEELVKAIEKSKKFEPPKIINGAFLLATFVLRNQTNLRKSKHD